MMAVSVKSPNKSPRVFVKRVFHSGCLIGSSKENDPGAENVFALLASLKAQNAYYPNSVLSKQAPIPCRDSGKDLLIEEEMPLYVQVQPLWDARMVSL